MLAMLRRRSAAQFRSKHLICSLRRRGAVFSVPSAARARHHALPLTQCGRAADNFATPTRSNRTVGGKSGATLYGTTANELSRAIVRRRALTPSTQKCVQDAGAGHRARRGVTDPAAGGSLATRCYASSCSSQHRRKRSARRRRDRCGSRMCTAPSPHRHQTTYIQTASP